MEEFTAIPDDCRDVRTLTVEVPDDVEVLDIVVAPVNPDDGKIAVDIFPTYLVFARDKESDLLKGLRATQ